MFTLDLSQFRPRDASSAAVHRAISDAAKARVACNMRITEAKEARDGLLLDGSPK